MQWYYERDGQQVGPVSQTEIVRLVLHHRIQPHTLVWHPSFGDEWRQARKAGLLPPSLTVKILSPAETGERPVGSVPTGGISSLWAWLLALVPSAMDAGLLIAGDVTHGAIAPSAVTLVCLYGIVFLTISQDRQTLARAGVRPPSFWWWLFLPGYFWYRRAALRRGTGLFVCYLLLLLLRVGVLFYNPPPGFPSLHQLTTQAGQSAASVSRDAPSQPQDGAPPPKKTPEAAPSDGSSSEQIQL